VLFQFKHKRPDTYFPDQVYMLSTFVVDVGDLNHSREFPHKFLPHVSNSVDERLKEH